jgi:hypothetical protein
VLIGDNRGVDERRGTPTEFKETSVGSKSERRRPTIGRCSQRHWSGQCDCFGPPCGRRLARGWTPTWRQCSTQGQRPGTLEAEQRWRLVSAWATMKRGGGTRDGDGEGEWREDIFLCE